MKIIQLILMSLCLQSCIKEIGYVPAEKADKYQVVHAFLSPDSLLRADISIVTGMLDNTEVITNADIDFFINNIDSQKLNYISETKYGGGINPMKPNDSFSMRVGGFISPIWIYGKVPNRIVVDAVDTFSNILPGLGKKFNFTIKFKDSAAHENYYRIYVKKISYKYIYDFAGQLADSIIVVDILPIEGRELPFVQNNYNNYTSKEILFSDVTINGVYNTFNFFTGESLKKSKQLRPTALEVHLENISKDLYNFYNTRNAHIWQQQSITQIPGLVEGNVPGGYGIVAAFTEKIVRINLP